MLQKLPPGAPSGNIRVQVLYLNQLPLLGLLHLRNQQPPPSAVSMPLVKPKLTMEVPTLLRLLLMAPLVRSLRISVAGNSLPPGLAAENKFAQQQQPQQQQAGPSYFQQRGEPEYINSPGYGQPPVAGYGAGGVGQLTDQFGQMGINGGQKPFQIYTTNLLTSPPDPRDLELPPPPIQLPAGSCLTNSPLANAHYSYQRSTVNAIPSSSSIVSKSKIPLGLIITPYRTVKEGEEPVPVVSDTIIARCRRCRTYINPYVQFIDGGNRYVHSIVPRTLNQLPSLAGAAVCVACRTRSHSCLTGIRPGTSLGIAGPVLS
jgi:hypothetical protein